MSKLMLIFITSLHDLYFFFSQYHTKAMKKVQQTTLFQTWKKKEKSVKGKLNGMQLICHTFFIKSYIYFLFVKNKVPFNKKNFSLYKRKLYFYSYF